jgi:hypothetical protein
MMKNLLRKWRFRKYCFSRKVCKNLSGYAGDHFLLIYKPPIAARNTRPILVKVPRGNLSLPDIRKELGL